MRWRWRVDRDWEEIQRLPWPLALFFGSNYVLATTRDVLVFFLALGVGIACLVVGTTVAHYIGAVLIAACLLVAYRFVRRHADRR